MSSTQKRFHDKKLKEQTNKEIIKSIQAVCVQIIDDLEKAKKPAIYSIKESSDNAIYDSKLGYLIPGDKKNKVELGVSSIKKMTRMLVVAEMLIENVKSGMVNSKREIYYRIKSLTKSDDNLKALTFESQEECDEVIDELCGLINKMREDFNVFANERSGLTYSNNLIVEETLSDGKVATIDLSQMGTVPFIPKNRPQDLKLSVKKGRKLDYCLVIESEGTLSTLHANGILQRNDIIIVSTGGQASMATRGWLKKIQDQLRIPIYAFLDLDAWSVAGIFRAAKSSAFNSLIRSPEFCATELKLLGVLPSDIKKYNLDYYKVNEKDSSEYRAIKRAEDALKNDPFFADKKNKKYKEVLEWLITNKIRCEQQALFGVDPKDPLITEKILVEKIKKGDYL
jgi:DNA topoisomerase-6 subunit A